MFLINWGNIRESVQNTRFLDRLFNRPEQSDPQVPGFSGLSPETPQGDAGGELVSPPAPSGGEGAGTPGTPEERPGGDGAGSGGGESSRPVALPGTAPSGTADAGGRVGSGEKPAEGAQKPPAEGQSVPERETRPSGGENRRERSLYFMQVDRDGTIVRTKVTRTLDASDSPMLDVLRTMLRGPTDEEQRRGLVSLIPRGTRVISATVRGSTAYINFSEEFQFNTYGIEGYAAQLRQIVFTVTEFANIKDVQILLEGRRVDYLGEGIWIGSPVGRDML